MDNQSGIYHSLHGAQISSQLKLILNVGSSHQKMNKIADLMVKVEHSQPFRLNMLHKELEDQVWEEAILEEIFSSCLPLGEESSPGPCLPPIPLLRLSLKVNQESLILQVKQEHIFKDLRQAKVVRCLELL